MTDMIERDEHIYVTANGFTLHLKPVNPAMIQLAVNAVRAEFRKAGELIDPPTWTVETQAGPQAFPHTLATLDVEGDDKQTAINHAMWEAHQQALERLALLQGERQMFVLLTAGIDIEGDWDTEDWKEQQAAYGIEVPSDPVRRKMHWLSTVALDQLSAVELRVKLEVMTQEGLLSREERAEIYGSIDAQIEARKRTAIQQAMEGITRAMSGEIEEEAGEETPELP